MKPKTESPTRPHRENSERVTFWADKKDKERWENTAYNNGQTLTEFIKAAIYSQEENKRAKAGADKKLEKIEKQILETQNERAEMTNQLEAILEKVSQNSTGNENPINKKLLLAHIRLVGKFDFEEFSKGMKSEEKRELLNSLAQLRKEGEIEFNEGETKWQQA